MSLLKKYFLYTSVILCSVTSSLFCAEPAEVLKISSTPQRSLGTGVLEEPTPGQRAAQKQAEVFAEFRFRQVFGDSFDQLLGTLDSDIIFAKKQWDVLSDITISFDDARKRLLVRKIKQWFIHYTGDRSHAYLLLSDDVTRLDSAITEVPRRRISESSLIYFNKIYPQSAIRCSDKQAGVQLGTIANIQTSEGLKLRYYVKTHSNGLISGHSSAAEFLRPQELMIYKILEKLGIGCESHFFGRDGKNFYIATLDANIGGKFREYSQFNKKNEVEILPLWGILTELSEDPKENEKNSQTIEDHIKSDRISQNFVYQMSFLDILARLMKLTDLQTNGDNFGFTNIDSGTPILKVIDFRLHETSDFSINSEHFGGFLVGNGFFNYYAADKAVCYSLRNRPKEQRVKEVKNIFETQLSEWEVIVESSKNLTAAALIESQIEENIKFTDDLNAYAEILKENFKFFKTCLYQWKPH